MPGYYQPSYVLASGIVFIIVCSIITCLRFVARLRPTKNSALGLDDWLVIPATIFIIGCGVIMIIGVQKKILASPTPDPDPENYYFSTVQKIQYAFILLQTLSLGCTKLSFVVFYRRIFCVGRWKSPFELASGIVGVCVICWTLLFSLWFTFSCPTDFGARWTSSTRFVEVCTTDTQFSVGLVISDFLTDLAVVTLPIVPVLKLHLRWGSKLLVLSIFAIGFLVLAISLVRMVFIIEGAYAITGGVNDAFLTTSDNDLVLTEAYYWSMIEAGVALICCCLPTMNSILTHPSVRSVVASLRSLRSIGSGRSVHHDRDRDRDIPAHELSKPVPLSKPSRSLSVPQGSGVGDGDGHRV